jgi:hypothetical protein
MIFKLGQGRGNAKNVALDEATSDPPLSPVRRVKRRTGLKIYEAVSIKAGGSPEDIDALKRMLSSASPSSRLDRIKRRAAQYEQVEDVQRELLYIEEVILPGGFQSQVLSFALLALERGLDLLDTGKYLNAIVRDGSTQVGRAKGAVVANAARAKLPPREALLQEIEILTRGNYRSERDAKSILLVKYRCSASALFQRLNPGGKVKQP